MKDCRQFAALLRVELTSASVAEMLTVINSSGITIKDVTPINALIVEGTIHRKDYQYLKKLLKRRGETIKITRKQGFAWTIVAVRKRPILVVGVAIILFFAMYLPTRVLFVRVEGNSSISTNQITTAAQRVGIYFGASRRHVRSEYVKNSLLGEFPQLQWVGVNTYGCVAVISVEERTANLNIKENMKVGHIVASCDGIVKEMTVTRGNALCKVGEAVRAGQVLVSGYTDCGITIKATAAQAEIYADTSHEIEAITPVQYNKRHIVRENKRRFYLIFGKNIIKLFKDSGISSTSCVKMYKENYLTLPGGFQLPVALVEEQLNYYTEQCVFLDNTQAYSWLDVQASNYVLEHMNAGKILNNRSTTVLWGDVVYLYGKYACYEMIGQKIGRAHV